MKPLIFLDNSFVTKPPPEVASEALPYLSEVWGSPLAPYGEALPLDWAYRAIYDFLGAQKEDHFVFTSSGAEAVNHVVAGVYREKTVKEGKNHFLCSQEGEAPAIMALHDLEKVHCTFEMLPVDRRGRVTVDALMDHVTPRTALLTLSWGNGLLGTLQEVGELAKVCRERGIFFHLDVTHVLGKVHFSFADLGFDAISFEGSCLHAPQGTGGLLWRKGLSPLILGGGEQGGQRGGPFFVGGLLALGKAFSLMGENRDYLCLEGARLRRKFEEAILGKIPGAVVYFADEERLPHVSCIGFPHIASEALLFNLSHRGVAANIGGGRFQQLSLLLEACGIETNGAVSFSLSYQTTDSEIDEAVRILAEEVEKLQKLSRWIAT